MMKVDRALLVGGLFVGTILFAALKKVRYRDARLSLLASHLRSLEETTENCLAVDNQSNA